MKLTVILEVISQFISSQLPLWHNSRKKKKGFLINNLEILGHCFANVRVMT